MSLTLESLADRALLQGAVIAYSLAGGGQMWLFLVIAACNGPVGDGDGEVQSDEVPQVGWVAQLRTHHHDTSGTATIVDEETIELTDFNYDGQGLNARLFLLADGETFHRDFELTENLVNGDGYAGETMTLSIPGGAPFKWNLISLWCIPASVSFGDGVFQAP